jgi:hypothetical protein
VHRRLQREVAGTIVIAQAPSSLRKFLRRNERNVFSNSASDPKVLYEYLSSVILTWFVLAILCFVLGVFFAYVGHLLGGETGKSIGIGLGFAPAWFCLVGAFYATWLRFYAWSALRRCRRVGGLDDRSRRAMHRAQLRNASLIAQLGLGVLIGVLQARAF